MAISQEDLRTVMDRGVAEIIDRNEFRKLLDRDKPLRLKMGFDPSSPDIHLGHTVGLRKLRQLQELGHKVMLIVGDWTAQIGDPSGVSATRPVLTHEQVQENAQTYMTQFFKVVDRDRTEVFWQSEWFGKFDLADVVRLTGPFTVAQMLAREDFRRRWDANRPIAITELLYPLLQAYDSVVVESDVEFGGTDQKFNLLMGRELQEMRGQRPQQCFMVPILVGTDGVQKMSKSLGNYIGVDDAPEEQYGKALSLPDDLIIPYFNLLSDLPTAEIDDMSSAMEGGANPMEFKKRLAREIVATFWSEEDAAAALAHFEQTVQRGEAPDEAPTLWFARSDGVSGAVAVSSEQGGAKTLVSLSTVEFLYHHHAELGLSQSRTAAKRLVSQGAVEVDGQPAGDTLSLRDGSVVRVGKRRYLRLLEDRS
ncbi:MAG: tyrosine--tRNA ligase [Chloroflexota bacterium]|nr:tyrosine--tRNA ligase [Chloroflexota bacterium]